MSFWFEYSFALKIFHELTLTKGLKENISSMQGYRHKNRNQISHSNLGKSAE